MLAFSLVYMQRQMKFTLLVLKHQSCSFVKDFALHSLCSPNI